ncbi:hypothetical protein AAFC00_007172 [Neodothiora populina]|uniref:AB hydrolase-1 domain-containing protein n=1 Tax=Neodothiora populina TaxID=2781224 RepID=A0ABR3PHE0_9PEZI
MATENTPNQMGGSNRHDYGSARVSATEHHIAGILATVYGLDELSASATDVACLWLLHPRLQKHTIMAPVAANVILEWNKKRDEEEAGGKKQRKGLIAVSFDQRNHGTREVNERANQSWKGGNPAHAPDMFSIFHGTARDTSILIDYLSSYIFPTGERTLTQHLALGVSLGGHSVWHCLLQDPRITTGVVVIGCPDFTRLMSQRARKTKLDSWTSAKGGKNFLGSKDFPKGLIEAVGKYDPAGLLLGELDAAKIDYTQELSDKDKERVGAILKKTLGGKKIMCLSGGADKLVPYSQSEPFLTFLKNAIKEGGWAKNCDITLEDIVDEQAGHEFSPKMQTEAVRFITEVLATPSTEFKTGSITSKI